MRTIREIREHEMDELMRISGEAFPGFSGNTPAERDRQRERLLHIMNAPLTHFMGVFEAEQMVGVMRLYDFTMKLRSTRTLVGGVGGVAVDLRHKRKKVAADMIRYFHDYYRNNGACLTALYPFRHDFYRRMGYGYGARMNRYVFAPSALRPGGDRSRVDFLGPDDRDAFANCYDDYVDQTNGLMEMLPHVREGLFTNPDLKVAGYCENGRLLGYLVFQFEPARDDNFLLNDLVVRSLVYNSTAALLGLLDFVRAQADQIRQVRLETQDATLHYLLNDPRNGTGNLLAGLWHESNTQGLGIMYRVIDTAALFATLRGHNFGGQTVRLRTEVADSFLPANAGATTIAFEDGYVTGVGDGPADVIIGLDISEFSSLAVGAASFRQLYALGLASISDDQYVDTVDRLFDSRQLPMCLTSF